MKILDRYIAKELSLIFLFFCLSFYFLYVLFDYSAHLKLFNSASLSYSHIITYYLWQFSQRIDIIFPLALMIATIKILITMNKRFEITAILAAGISFKRFFRSFICAAFFCMLCTFLNFEFLQPASHTFIHNFETSFLKKGNETTYPVNAYHLDDNTLLLFQHFDHKRQVFSHAFLIPSSDKMYRIEKLYLQKDHALGKNVDILIRKENNEISKKESRENTLFPKIEIDEKRLHDINVYARVQSLTHFFKKLDLKGFGFKMSDKEAEIMSYFSYKLNIPFLSLLAVLAPATFCIRINRKLPIFLIYAAFLFGILALFTLMNSFLVLSLNQVLPPFWGLCLLTIFCMILFGRRYGKL